LSYRETIGKYKQVIIIVAAAGAIASYMLPLQNLLVQASPSHTDNANAKARAALTGHSAHSSKTTTPSSDSKTTTPKNSKTTTPTNNGNGNTNTNRIPAGKDGPNGAQIGGPDDNGNIGHGNQGTGNTGNFNNGNDLTGNFNNNPPGQTGNFCGNGAGHHYGCILHNPHFTG
jgi:hypothetical protein